MKIEIFQPATETIEYFTEERCYITEVCNTPISPNGSLAIARVPSGTTTQLHSLNGIDETYIVIEGKGEVEVDGDLYSISAGDQVAIPAGASQRATSRGENDLRFYCLCTPRFRPDSYINLEVEKTV